MGFGEPGANLLHHRTGGNRRGNGARLGGSGSGFGRRRRIRRTERRSASSAARFRSRHFQCRRIRRRHLNGLYRENFGPDRRSCRNRGRKLLTLLGSVLGIRLYLYRNRKYQGRNYGSNDGDERSRVHVHPPLPKG